MSPGIGFGEYGEGYVRIALCGRKRTAHRQAARSAPRFLGDVGKNSKVLESVK